MSVGTSFKGFMYLRFLNQQPDLDLRGISPKKLVTSNKKEESRQNCPHSESTDTT